jgi:hypothetical protein
MDSAPSQYKPKIKWNTDKLFLANANIKQSLYQMINNVKQNMKLKFAINDQNMLAISFCDIKSG